MLPIVIYTEQDCPYCRVAKRLLSEKGQEWTEIDVGARPAGLDEMIRRTGSRTVPQIFIGDRQIAGFEDLAALEDAGELDALLGREREQVEGHEHRRVAIVGSGPAGYTAAIYTGRAELEPVVVAGLQSGGQLMLTTEVENFPGFPEGVTGPELMERLQKQAERFGAHLIMEDATEIDLARRPFRVKTAAHAFSADALILATGASAQWMGLESETRLQNKGVSACATCDGALFRGKPMAVVGGGDVAMEEAIFLTRFASKVTVIHRRDQLRASKIMQERALANEKIEFLWNSVVEEVLGDEFVTGVRVRDVRDGSTGELAVEALFVAIGHRPNTELMRGAIELDPAGYIRVEPGMSRTSVEGVFACGDVVDPTYRQAITAAGSGCMAAIDAERWLGERGIT
jgi:thioredoxin reductase (NADPH)